MFPSKIPEKPTGEHQLLPVVSAEDRFSFSAIQQIQEERIDIIMSKDIRVLLIMAISSATADYLWWQEKTIISFTLFHHHGADGKTRAKKVNSMCETINPFKVLSDFANNSITDEKEKPIPGNINTNSHSYISFILNNIKKFPKLVDHFATKNGVINKNKLDSLKKTDFFINNKETRNLRTAYIEDFKNLVV